MESNTIYITKNTQNQKTIDFYKRMPEINLIEVTKEIEDKYKNNVLFFKLCLIISSIMISDIIFLKRSKMYRKCYAIFIIYRLFQSYSWNKILHKLS